MRISRVAFLLLAAPIAAQQPRQITAADYARAERLLSPNASPLVSGAAGRPTWLGDGRFWYRATTANGSAFYLVNPVRRTRQPVFDHARLAAALAAATSGTVDADRLPFQTFDLAEDGRTLSVTIRDNKATCDLQAYTCTSTAAGRPPRNASVAPNGKLAVSIRDHNLWAKDLAGEREMQLTTDGVEDFGYATNNAGWIHSDSPVLTWSPDSRQIATFQHDGRGVRDMHLVSTNVGSPRLESWKYPLPGDSVIFRISRVILSEGPNGTPRMVRLQMPPDAHRSTVSDHVACGGEICDVQWYPDGSHLASSPPRATTKPPGSASPMRRRAKCAPFSRSAAKHRSATRHSRRTCGACSRQRTS
jgi:hypothetical protein